MGTAGAETPIELFFELQLEERLADRVFVSVVLAPKDGSASAIDGVAVRMLTRSGEPLSPRHLLPIAGTVSQPMVSTVELRARGPIPPGAYVQGQTWSAEREIQARCPCDPGTALGTHMRGRKLHPLHPERHALTTLTDDERARLVDLFPWLSEPMIPRSASAVLEVTPNSDELVDEVAEQFDLDPEDAEFLKELLGDDDDFDDEDWSEE